MKKAGKTQCIYKCIICSLYPKFGFFSGPPSHEKENAQHMHIIKFENKDIFAFISSQY